MSKYPAYPAYKDSGINWLGDVPEHWNILKIKFLLLPGSDGIKIGPFGSSLKLETTTDVGYKVYGQENVIKNNFSIGEKYIDNDKFNELCVYQIFPNDIVITMMGTTGKSKVVPEDIQPGIMDSHLIRLRTDPNICDANLFSLFINDAPYIRSQIQMLSKGSIMEGLNSSIIKSISIFVPPLQEQHAITKFLDQKTALIDDLISKKERQIELMKEKRTSLINRAVTKGLNPDVEMKDSGIEWLGEVPKHWNVKRLKYFIDFLTSGSRGWAEYYSDEGDIFIRIGNLTRDSINLDLSDIQYVTPPKGAEGQRTKVQAGDLLVSITAYLGSIAVVPDNFECAYVSQHVALARPLKKSNSKWLGYSLLSDMVKNQLNMQAYGGTKIQLSLDDVRELVILEATSEEQKAIVKQIEIVTIQNDGAITMLQSQIEKLREYRQSLISATVTGKIDVTNYFQGAST